MEGGRERGGGGGGGGVGSGYTGCRKEFNKLEFMYIILTCTQSMMSVCVTCWS